MKSAVEMRHRSSRYSGVPHQHGGRRVVNHWSTLRVPILIGAWGVRWVEWKRMSPTLLFRWVYLHFLIFANVSSTLDTFRLYILSHLQ